MQGFMWLFTCDPSIYFIGIWQSYDHRNANEVILQNMGKSVDN